MITNKDKNCYFRIKNLCNKSTILQNNHLAFIGFQPTLESNVFVIDCLEINSRIGIAIFWRSWPVYKGLLMRIHYPKLRNMTRARYLSVFIAFKGTSFLYFIWFGLVFCLTLLSTIFQTCWDGATASWVLTSTLGSLKCLAQGHNTAIVVYFA